MKEIQTLTKVSIIIPTYNVSKYIEGTIYSVINQSFRNYELIIVDDGSTDNTVEVAENILHNSNINYKIIKQTNKGVSVARNIGIDNAMGEYIYILDSDDIIHKDFLTEMLLNAESNNSDIVFCGFDKVDENNNVIEKYEELYSYTKNIMNGEEIIKLILKEKTWICTISGMYKRSLINDNSIRYTPKCTNGEDQEFCMKNLANAKKVTCVKRSLAYYVQRTSSISYSGSLRKFTALGAVRRIIKYFKSQNMDKEIIDALILNKYNKEFFRNLNSVLKYNSNSEFIDIVINNKKFLKQLKKYKPLELSLKELKFLIRYKVYLFSPKLYIRIMSMLLK